MNRSARHAAIRATLAGRPDVPSVRVMAKLIGAGWRAVARDYAALQLTGSVPAGRPPSGRRIVVGSCLPQDVYDAYCRAAQRRNIKLATMIRMVLVARAPTI